MLSRRGFLFGGVATLIGAGAGGYAAVEEDWLPGRLPLQRLLGHCDVDAALPAAPPGPVSTATFASAYRQREVTWTLASPPSVSLAGLPVVVALHPRGGDARSAFSSMGLDRFLADHVSAGGRPYAIAGVDGGVAYWHPREGGDDPLGMVVHELLPLLRSAGLRTDRIGTIGWSMGGYGALLLARESARDALDGTVVVAAVADSPALFGSYAESAAGAFDDAADFSEWGALVTEPEVSADVALCVSCGDTDPFTEATERYRAAVRPEPTGGISRGCHDAGYWRSQAATQIAFLGEHLA